MRSRPGLAALLALGLALAACGSDEEPVTSSSSSTVERSTSTTDEATTTTADDATTTTAGADDEATTTTTGGTESGLQPGDPCSLEEGEPDCIDPDGDGEGQFLVGGASCMEALADSPELCTDLDGDGYAGYPDSG